MVEDSLGRFRYSSYVGADQPPLFGRYYHIDLDAERREAELPPAVRRRLAEVRAEFDAYSPEVATPFQTEHALSPQFADELRARINAAGEESQLTPILEGLGYNPTHIRFKQLRTRLNAFSRATGANTVEDARRAVGWTRDLLATPTGVGVRGVVFLQYALGRHVGAPSAK